MSTTPRLQIQMMATNDVQKEVLFNEALILFDAVVARSVKSVLNVPASTPVDGDTYIVGNIPSGVWAGRAHKIAFWYNGWRYITPTNKMKFFNEATSTYWTFTGGAWYEDAAAFPTVLDDLSDVSATSPADGQTLVWSETTNTWVLGLPATSVSFSDLLDVDVSGITNGQVATWDDTEEKWVPADLPVFTMPALMDLSDVESAGASTGFVLTWNTTTGKASFEAPATSAYDELGKLTDVTIPATPSVNDVLAWNGSVWAPSTVAITYSFLGMVDGPGTFDGHANKFLVVDDTESEMVFKSFGELLGTTEFLLQDLADMPATIDDGDVGHYVRVWKDGSDYKFEYAEVDFSLAVFDESSELTPKAKKLTFVGFDVSESAPDEIVVTNQGVVEYLSDGGTVGAVSALNFTGSGVLVDVASGVMTVDISGGGGGSATLSGLTDTNITGPVDGQALIYDATSEKWVPGENTVPSIDGEAHPAMYEHGPFAPPTAAMFPLRFNAASADLLEIENRGFMFMPGAQGAGIKHQLAMRELSNDSAPWEVTARVVPSGRITGHAGGIALQRSANNAIVFLNIGEADGDTQSIMRFGHVNAAAAETITTSKAAEFNWLRLTFDGNNIIGKVSNDGILWHTFGTLSAATVLGGPPDLVAIGNRSNSSHSGEVGAFFTYYEDADFPASVRTTGGVVAVGLGGLLDVDLSTPPTDGQTIVWDDAAEKWVPGTAVGGSGASALSELSDVDTTTTPPEDGQVLVWSDTATKWLPGASGNTAPIAVATHADNYTLVLADAGSYVRMSKATANTLTVPTNAVASFPVGAVIQLRQAGAGQTTIVAASGVTINTSETLKLRKQGSTASLIKVAANEWDLTGDLELV